MVNALRVGTLEARFFSLLKDFNPAGVVLRSFHSLLKFNPFGIGGYALITYNLLSFGLPFKVNRLSQPLVMFTKTKSQHPEF
jgi:hypothetical protein